MPTLDRQNIAEIFDMQQEEPIEAEIVEGPDEFEVEFQQQQDAEDVDTLKDNIKKANEFIDKIQTEMENGNFSARLMEVAGQMINSITAASKVLIDNTNYQKYMEIRQALVLLKQREVKVKELRGRRPSQQNLIVASRDDVMKYLESKSGEPDEAESNSENK